MTARRQRCSRRRRHFDKKSDPLPPGRATEPGLAPGTCQARGERVTRRTKVPGRNEPSDRRRAGRNERVVFSRREPSPSEHRPVREHGGGWWNATSGRCSNGGRRKKGSGAAAAAGGRRDHAVHRQPAVRLHPPRALRGLDRGEPAGGAAAEVRSVVRDPGDVGVGGGHLFVDVRADLAEPDGGRARSSGQTWVCRFRCWPNTR